jgi:protein disulfide-isomerase
MRTAIALTCVLIGAWTAYSVASDKPESPVWRQDTYAAWKASQESGRPLVLFITSDNCPYCHLMDRNTFADQNVLARLRKSFVAARIEAARHPELTSRLQIQAYPTTLVVDKSNRIVDAMPGYVEPREFERRLAQWSGDGTRTEKE